MAELDPVVGSEQGGTRPVAIIQNDMGNLHSPTVIAVPLTGSTGKPALPTHVHIPRGEGGLWREVRTIRSCHRKEGAGRWSAQRVRYGCVDAHRPASTSRPTARSRRVTVISGRPISAVGSSEVMRSSSAMPRPSALALPAQS